jgi:hypothetical protein
VAGDAAPGGEVGAGAGGLRGGRGRSRMGHSQPVARRRDFMAGVQFIASAVTGRQFGPRRDWDLANDQLRRPSNASVWYEIFFLNHLFSSTISEILPMPLHMLDEMPASSIHAVELSFSGWNTWSLNNWITSLTSLIQVYLMVAAQVNITTRVLSALQTIWRNNAADGTGKWMLRTSLMHCVYLNFVSMEHFFFI